MMKDKEVVVIGAGIAGLAAAVAMAQRGAKVKVLERSPGASHAGAGLQISPNGFTVLEALGLGDALLAVGLEARAVELRDYRAGRRVLRFDLGKLGIGKPFVLVQRAQLITLLMKEAHRTGVELVLGVSADPKGISGSLVVGADGIRSATRRHLNGPEVPFFTGQAAWRAIVADDAAPEAHVWMGPGRHLVTYAMGEGIRNIVAIEERRQWVEEGWNQADDPANLQASFAGFAPEVRHWLDQVEEVRLWGLFRHEVAAHWHGGRFVILGDAAHPTLPFLAQGANLALEDAWILAHCLDRLPQREALEEYQRRRHSRVVRVVAAATANARNFHLSNPLIRGAAHTALRLRSAFLPKATLKRLEWLYGFDVTNG